MKKAVQRGRKKPGLAETKKQTPYGYWKNPEHMEQMHNAIRTHLSRNPHATAEELARLFGYTQWTTVSQIMRQGKGNSFRLSELGKAQEAGKHGGFRRRRPPQERRALYKRILQEIIKNPFLEYGELAQKMRMSFYSIGGAIARMRDSGHMPPLFFETQRLKAVHGLAGQGLTQREIASRLGVTQQALSKYYRLLKKIKEFAAKRGKPIDWVINRYGTLVKKGMIEKENKNRGGIRILRKTKGGVS